MSAHAYQLPAWYGLTFMAVVCVGAFWKGGREEQVAAAGVMLSWLVTLVLHDPRWLGPQWGAFGADVALLAVITVVAVRSPHYWPLFAAAFQLLCVMIHVARLSDPGVRAWAYATGQVIFTQLYMWAIVVGIWNSWRARRRQLETSDAPVAAPRAEPGATLR